MLDASTKLASGTRTRAFDEACPLCTIASDPAFMMDDGRTLAKLMSRMWDLGPDRIEGAREATRLLAETGIGADPVVVRRHYRYHLPEQPAPAFPLNSAAAYRATERLSERQRAILDLIYRVGMLTSRQVADALYPGESRRKAVGRAREDLSELARLQQLHRFIAPTKLRGLGRTVWMLGRDSRPWLSRRFDARLGHEHATRLASSVGVMNLPHDLGANDLMLRLARSVDERMVKIDAEREALVWMSLDNWWASRHLAFGYWDPYMRQRTQLIADGFVALSVQVPGEAHSELLPCFIEYDRDTKQRLLVAKQLLAYHGLGASDAVAERFPDLAGAKTRTPVVMVMRDMKRVPALVKSFEEEAKKLGVGRRERHPIYIAGEKAWRNDPLTAQLISVWNHNERKRLIPLLRDAATPLRQAGRVDAYTSLRFDPRGGRGGGRKFQTLGQLASGKRR